MITTTYDAQERMRRLSLPRRLITTQLAHLASTVSPPGCEAGIVTVEDYESLPTFDKDSIPAIPVRLRVAFALCGVSDRLLPDELVVNMALPPEYVPDRLASR